MAPLSFVRLNRGTGGKACSSFSCDGIGAVGIAVSATDDMAAPTDIGFRYSIVAGTGPKDLFPSAGEAIRPLDGELWLNWQDGPPDDHMTIDFTLRIVALDRAGNASVPRILRVHDDVGGCRIVTAVGSPGRTALVFGLMVLVAALRSRRRRQSAAVTGGRCNPKKEASWALP